MPMMREKNRLNLFPYCSQGPEPVGCAILVETGEEVITNERDRLGILGELFDVSQPKRKIQLITSSFAKTGNAD
jgi:hypothetical protein